MADEDIQIGRYVVPASELSWSFATSGGPGGQHANRSNTRAELRFDLAASDVFPPAVNAVMVSQLGSHIVNGTVVVIADESRSQWRNRAIARRRLGALLERAMHEPTPRKKTRPTRASRQRRVADKRARSDVKRLRRRPDDE
jgi:ribosome-associated protein